MVEPEKLFRNSYLMRRLTIVILFAAIAPMFLANSGYAFVKNEQTDHTVPQVDLQRYMGRWYEIASFPNWFQKGCHCTIAEYKLSGNGVLIRNSCRKGSSQGELKIAGGKAFAVPGSNNSQLKVQFQWPFWGHYWIIALDENYEYAVVGHPKRKYLWVLSRNPLMGEETYRKLEEIARAKGYDVNRLKKTDQSCDHGS
jgi:apolipoprotein D and lipocalin family protein